MINKAKIISGLDHLRRRWRELRKASAGNVAITFALTLVPVAGCVGAAVDYSRANSAKVAMQAAADATALMLSKTAATVTSAQLQTSATNYFKALFNRSEVTGLTVTPTYTTAGGSKITVKATGSLKADFMALFGVTTMSVGAFSQVDWGNTRLRVALVLDNTGSMQDNGKIGALITATKGLLTQLKTAAVNNGDVYVSIVPFVKDVNVGKSNYNATWIDWSEWDADNGNDVSTQTCTKNGRRTKCTTSTSWVPDNHNTWNGCVTDRGNSNAPSSGNYDTNATVPTTTIQATLYTAEQYDYCPAAAVMPLGYDWTAMTNLVNSMTPNGNTNQAIGLQLGWQSLVGGGPFPTPPAMDPNYQYSQVIILLTDGLNTENRWYTNQNQIDARQAMTCANVKAAGITLYTVQVNTGGDPTSSLLKTCASDASKFFLLTSATQMVATFQQIGTALSNLRVAK
jgi:Flp pilus assembly protein TadG